MKDALELDIHGIKCDACDYRDDEVKVEDYDKWLNKPCPKCGANLLTEADYNNVKMLIAITNSFNGIFPQREDDEEVSTMSIEMNGTGDINLEVSH